MIGTLPIRVLISDAISTCETISSSFRELLESESQYNDFKSEIKYHVNYEPICEIAQIDSNHYIHLYENFCHYLWCITYSMIIQFDWFASQRNLNTIKIEQYDRAVRLFDTAFLLLRPNYDVNTFFELPNPEIYKPEESEYIEAVNNVFNYSIAYYMLHEFGHQFYGHLDIESNSIEEYKDDERKADEFAIDTMLKDTSLNDKYGYELGIVFALVGITMIENDLNGGDKHPNNDERLTMALNKMESDDTWEYAAMGLILWNMKHGLKIEIPAVDGTYKDLFNSTIEKINSKL